MTVDFVIDSIREHALDVPDRAALVGSKRKITYRELWDAIQLHPGRDSSVSDRIQEVLNILRRRMSWESSLNQVLETFSPDVSQKILSCPIRPGEIIMSSGSTGVPKRVFVSFSSQQVTAESINLHVLDGNEVDEVLVLPLVHSSGLGRLRAAIVRGSTVHVPELPLRPKYLASLGPQPIALAMVPSLWRYLSKLLSGDVWRYLESVVSIEFGSAPLTDRDLDELISGGTGSVALKMHFGLTEASRSMLRDLRVDDDPNSIGAPLPHVEAELIDLPGISGVGELKLRGGHVADWVSDGIGINFPKENGGWLPTGDLASATQNGFSFEGRLRMQANVGGRIVNTRKVEEQVARLLDRAQVVAVPIADQVLGQRVGVVFSAPYSADIERLMGMLRSSLEKHEIPKVVQQIAEIPLLPSGKIDLTNILALLEKR